MSRSVGLCRRIKIKEGMLVCMIADGGKVLKMRFQLFAAKVLSCKMISSSHILGLSYLAERNIENLHFSIKR